VAYYKGRVSNWKYNFILFSFQGDPIKDLVRKYLGEQEANKRPTLTVNHVEMNENGLRKLLVSITKTFSKNFFGSCDIFTDWELIGYSPSVRETAIQFPVESYQRLKKLVIYTKYMDLGRFFVASSLRLSSLSETLITGIVYVI